MPEVWWRICFSDSTQLIEVLSSTNVITPVNWSFFLIGSSETTFNSTFVVFRYFKKKKRGGTVAGATVLGILLKKSRIYLSLAEHSWTLFLLWLQTRKSLGHCGEEGGIRFLTVHIVGGGKKAGKVPTSCTRVVIFGM